MRGLCIRRRVEREGASSQESKEGRLGSEKRKAGWNHLEFLSLAVLKVQL